MLTSASIFFGYDKNHEVVAIFFRKFGILSTIDEICKYHLLPMMEVAVWCAEIAKRNDLPQELIEEFLEQQKGDRLLLENVLATSLLVQVSPTAVIEAILERRG